MKKRSVMGSGLVALMLIAGGVVNGLRPNHAQARTNNEQTKTIFKCDESGTNPVTRVRTSRGEVPVIIWATGFFPPPYTPLVRCRQVSGRFQTYQEEGRLDILTTGWMNNQPVICVTDAVDNPCRDLLMTLRPWDDPRGVLEGLLNVRDLGSAPIKHYCPQAVYRSNGRTYIDMDELLERKELMADGDCQPLNVDN